jgi:putative ABC transport system permease protein
VQMRVRAGDDASCRNLNLAQTVRLVGVPTEQLAKLGAFTFSSTIDHPEDQNPWLLLNKEQDDETVPAIGDAATVLWGLHKGVGDKIAYTDGRGRKFDVEIVGLVQNSILQGSLYISEDQFKFRYPDVDGYQMFLIDVQNRDAGDVAKTLTRAMADIGFDLTPAVQELADFNSVQNTYLTIFQLLGELGLLLGSVGLGVVVLRNLLERRSELAVLRAVGFRKGSLHWLVLSEHWLLLGLGLGCGVVSAAVAVLPALLSPGSGVAYDRLAIMLGAVVVSGLLWTWLATVLALRGPLLGALRNE